MKVLIPYNFNCSLNIYLASFFTDQESNSYEEQRENNSLLFSFFIIVYFCEQYSLDNKLILILKLTFIMKNMVFV